MKKYNKENGRKSIRLKNWDYAGNGTYFITLVVKNRRKIFGKIICGKMHLSQYGKIADEYWKQIAILNNKVILGEHIVMPDHIHGIITISKDSSPPRKDDEQGSTSKKDTSTIKHETLYRPNNQSHHKKISPPSRSLPRIIGSYKSAVSKEIRKTKPRFGWVTRYYESIIGNQESYQKIENYIRKNPSKWNDDAPHHLD